VVTALEAEEAVTELLGSLTGKAAAAYYNLESRVSSVSVFSDKTFPKGIREQISAGLKEIGDCGLDVGAGKLKSPG